MKLKKEEKIEEKERNRNVLEWMEWEKSVPTFNPLCIWNKQREWNSDSCTHKRQTSTLFVV